MFPIKILACAEISCDAWHVYGRCGVDLRASRTAPHSKGGGCVCLVGLASVFSADTVRCVHVATSQRYWC